MAITVSADPLPENNGVLYVTVSGAGLQDGSSWANACAGLSTALKAAQNNGDIKQIWVTKGTYKPEDRAGDGTTDRHKAFVLVAGVKVYGGFTGNETSLNARNVLDNITILSGDLDGNDGANFANNEENTYHVVIGAGITDALLDGFTISGGNANGDEYITVNGELVVNGAGGGITNTNATSTFANLTVSENKAALFGGGIINVEGGYTFTNLTVSGNTADYGGGIYNMLEESASTTAFTNLVVSGNKAYYGGGIYNYFGKLTFTNATVSGNTADNSGGGIYHFNTYSSTIANGIVWGNNTQVYDSNSQPVYSYSVVQGLNLTGTGVGNFDGAIDPQFVSAIPFASAPTTSGDYQLAVSSPYIGKGSNAANTTGTDLAGKPRIIGSNIDLGAYEKQITLSGSVTISGIPEYNRTLTAVTNALKSNPEGEDLGTLSYQWYSENDPVGANEDQYTLLPTDIGKQITVKVTTVYGSITSAPTTTIVGKVTIVVTPDASQGKSYGQSDPESFSYTVSGWIGEAQPEIFSGALTRKEGENAGSYEILQGTLKVTSDEYKLDFTEGVTFSISQALHSINFHPETNLVLESGYYMLNATTSSGLTVQFRLRSQDSAIAALEGRKLILKQTGVIVVTAYVEAYTNYAAPTPVSWTITITNQVTGITSPEGLAIKLYPNPVKENVTLSGLQGGEIIRIMDVSGRTLITHKAQGVQEIIPVSRLQKGMYFVRITNGVTTKTLKLIKE
ncbi:MAG: T9SS type A sorting domain-containing protein [Bacteroidales bacterium]|nr:T9SS type A sorting domain-containing protein [Bacteroidales bacterium]